MIKNILFKLIMINLLCCFIATAFALTSDEKKPLHIQSNSITYDQQRNSVTYIGKVHALQGTTVLTGQKTIVYTRAGRIVKLIDFGHPATYTTLPDHKKQKLFARAKTIIYYPNLHIVWLLKDGYVREGGNIFTGDRIKYNVLKQTVDTSPSLSHTETTLFLPARNKDHS